MDFVKAKEILKAIEALDPDSVNTILEALKIAEHVEAASGEFYKKEAEKTAGSGLEAFFNFLVKEEDMHLAKIKELEGMLKKGKMDNIKFTITAPPGIHAIPSGQEEMTAVLYGLWREKKAVEFYTQAGEKTAGAVKKFFLELAGFEKGHVALFEQIVESAQNTEELIMG
jgi:rubrerythrin